MLKENLVFSILLVLILVVSAACAAEPTQSPSVIEPEIESSASDQAEEPAVVDSQDTDIEEPEVDEPETVEEVTSDEDLSEQGEALLNERCAVCHSVETSTSKVKTLAEWETTIDRMIQKGAELTSGERDILAAYLAENAGQ